MIRFFVSTVWFIASWVILFFSALWGGAVLMWVAPLTGLSFLAGLGYWQAYWLYIFIVFPASAGATFGIYGARVQDDVDEIKSGRRGRTFL